MTTLVFTDLALIYTVHYLHFLSRLVLYQ